LAWLPATLGCSRCRASRAPQDRPRVHRHAGKRGLSRDLWSRVAGDIPDHLRGQGALASHYFGTSHFSLGNYIALISGQAPNPATEYDCPQFTEFVSSGFTADGQAIGSGCVYPASVPTIANQLEAAALSWKAYMEDMGNTPWAGERQLRPPAIGAAR
jgi:hypothetical protein